MTKKQRVRTREEVKQEMAARGISATQWAKENGFSPLAVHQVLNGFLKGRRGTSHQIAVALGIKSGSDSKAA